MRTTKIASDILKYAPRVPILSPVFDLNSERLAVYSFALVRERAAMSIDDSPRGPNRKRTAQIKAAS